MWESFPGGEVLVRQGDAGECMWFVVRGRLRVSTRQADGVAHAVGEIGAGECVGEMALLSKAPRAATVKVVRDAELLRLPRSAFDRLVGAHPEAMLRLSRAIVGRLQRTLGARPTQLAERTVALPAAGPGVPLAAFAEVLSAELSRMARTALLDGTAETRQTVASGGSAPEVVVLVCDATQTSWTTRCLRQADDLVVVARADGDVRPGPLEQEALAAAGRREAGCHLVLLQSPERAPRGTKAWLAARPGVHHHHVRPGRVADHARLARLLSGRAIGLALSGGGARGFAHIGVLRALHEAGVPVECPSGWALLWDRLRRRPWRAPPVFVSLTRAFTLASDERAQAAGRDADLTLRPPLDRYASSDFKHIDSIAEIGFRHASEHVAEWTAGRQ